MYTLTVRLVILHSAVDNQLTRLLVKSVIFVECAATLSARLYFHYEDVEALEKDVWRVQMGQGDLWNSNEGSSHNADASYQGTGSCD